MTLRWRLFAVAVLCSLSLRAADASMLSQQYTASWASPGFFPLNGAQVYVQEVRNEADRQASFDYTAYLAEQVRQRLSAGGMTVVASGDASALVVDISIHLYQEGSAFGRWLGPGAGASYAVVQAHFRKGGQAEGADLLTVSVIASGGLFSAGGDKTVLEDTADEIVAFLQGKAKK